MKDEKWMECMRPGCEYVFVQGAWNHLYCSRKCSREHRLPSPEARSCAICGCSYVSRYKRQTTCSDACSRRYHAQRQAERYTALGEGRAQGLCEGPGCQRTVMGRSHRRFCSNLCRTRAHRARQRES